MKEFKNILFASLMLSLAISISCTEDDDIEDLDGGGATVSDSAEVVLGAPGQLILGQDTFPLGLGALEAYGIESEGEIPFLGYTNIDGKRCLELPYNSDILLQGGTYTVDQLNSFMEAESQEEFEALVEEFGPGKVVGIFSWMDHDEEDITSGEYKGGTLFFNEKFPNYAVSSIEELDEFIEGKYEETYGSACMECEDAYQSMCAGDEMTFEVWDEEIEDYVEITEVMTGERLYETYLYSGNCRLTGVDRTWMDEVCEMEGLSFGSFINEFEIAMISADESGQVTDEFYDVSNVTLNLEILGGGIYSINAFGDIIVYDQENEEYISDPVPFSLNYAGSLYEEDYKNEEGYDDEDYFEECSTEELSVTEGWWVDSVSVIYPDAEIKMAFLNICETGDYRDEHVIVHILDDSHEDEGGDGEIEIDHFLCEIVFENSQQELVYNGCSNCEYVNIPVDEEGYWTAHLDSAYDGVVIDHIELVDCSQIFPGEPIMLTIYLENNCYITFDHENEIIWSEYCEYCTYTEYDVDEEGYWTAYIPEDQLVIEIFVDECEYDDRLPESFLYIYFESGCYLIFNDMDEELIVNACEDSGDFEECSYSEVSTDEQGYWSDFVGDSSTINQMIISTCRSEFDLPEPDYRILFILNADSSVKVIRFDEEAQEVDWDTDSSEQENFRLISIDDLQFQWASMISEKYPDKVIEAVYKNSYEDEDESWVDIFVFFEDNCFVIFDDFNGEIFEDTCNDWRYDEDDADGTEIEDNGRKEIRSRTIFRKSTASTVNNSKIKYYTPSTGGKKTELIKKGVIRNKIDYKINPNKRHNSNIRKVKKSQFSFMK